MSVAGSVSPGAIGGAAVHVEGESAMSAEANKAIVRRFYAATGDVDHAAALVSDDLVDHSLPPGFPQGVAGYRRLMAMADCAFSDIRVTLEDLLAEGDKITDRLTVRARHTGEFMGIPGTGKRVTITATNIHRLAEGKIAEHWGDADQLGLLQQLGALPVPEAANW